MRLAGLAPPQDGRRDWDTLRDGWQRVAKPTPEPPGRLFPREETRALPGAVAVLSPSCAVSLLAGFSVIDRLASGIFTPPSISGVSASI